MQVDIIHFNVESLQRCDNIDSNYSVVKTIQIINETNQIIITIKDELSAKLKRVEIENAVSINTSNSLSWLAILMMSLLFSIIILNDLYKLIFFLKKNSFCINNQVINSENEENIELEKRVFRKELNGNNPRKVPYLREKIIKINERRWRLSFK